MPCFHLSACVRMTFVGFTDCEGCTRPISTNPVSMELGEYWPTCGAHFFAVCLEVVAVARLMWVSWCVLGGVDRFGFIFLRTHMACCKCEAALPHLPLYEYRGAYRAPLFNLSVCLCVCAAFVGFTDCESCTRPISTYSESMEAGEYGLTRETCFVARHLEVIAVAGLLRISWCVLGGADFFVFFCFL